MKITQREIAETLEISESQFSLVLSGKRHLEYKTALRLVKLIPSDPIIWIKGGGTAKQRGRAYYFQQWMDIKKEDTIENQTDHAQKFCKCESN